AGGSRELGVKRRFVCFLVVAVLDIAPGIGAQEPAPRVLSPYRLQGTVTGRDGGHVPAADIAVIAGDRTERVTRSDSAGRFRIDSLTAPTLTLHVRRLGFQPQQLTVNVTKAGRTATVDVTLEPSVANLDPVVIDDAAEPAEPPNPRLIGFKERAATNSFGHYITEAMLARSRPQHASEALRTVPGVVVGPARRI